MKKRILAALLAGVTAFSLAACSSGGSGMFVRRKQRPG